MKRKMQNQVILVSGIESLAKSLATKKIPTCWLSIAIHSFSMCIVISVNKIAWATVTFCPNQTIISAVSFTLMIYKHYDFPYQCVVWLNVCKHGCVCRCAGAQGGEIPIHIIKSSSSKPKPFLFATHRHIQCELFVLSSQSWFWWWM